MPDMTWDQILQSLADDPSEFDRDGDEVLLVRHGNEHVLKIANVAGVGDCVMTEATDSSQPDRVPIETYIQREILELPRLARQMVKAIEFASSKRPGSFVEGPAEMVGVRAPEPWRRSRSSLLAYLEQTPVGMTRLVQLMAAAGKGKTVLLENTALECARSYQPSPHPRPLLLTIDLLGRYVGNIDDAIAGSLNNTYRCPGLSQRDVLMCVRNRWMVLSLDGFDELVARVGVRDAFVRINDLVEQLQGAGTIILSARESFFELYQVSAAIRAYLHPKMGSYGTSVVRLLPWTDLEGRAFFANLGSADPAKDLNDLLSAFGGDAEIVLHPFFLTRLADLWTRGERFADAGKLTGQLDRTSYVVETFIEREAKEKWVDRDGIPYLPQEGHTALLSGVAEEMWRSGAFRLDKDEVRIAAEMGLSGRFEMAPDRLAAVVERAPMHGALSEAGGRYAFIHDQFLHYYLGLRVADAIMRLDLIALGAIMGAREFAPSVCDWVAWAFLRGNSDPCEVIRVLEPFADRKRMGPASLNASLLVARILDDAPLTTPAELSGYLFVGDILARRHLKNLRFVECTFWNLDLRGTGLSRCTFLRCEFADVLVDAATDLSGCDFDEGAPLSIETAEAGSVFSPVQIEGKLIALGAAVRHPSEHVEIQPPQHEVASDVARCVERFVKASQHTCDVAVEDIEDHFGRTAKTVARIGLQTGVLREIRKGVSGPRRTFVRFAVDRTRLLRGQLEDTGDAAIDGFWEKLSSRSSLR